MNKSQSSSPLYQFLLDRGLTQTYLRKNYGTFGTVVPLADKLLPEIQALHLVNKNGKPIVRRQQVVEALCAIRNLRTVKRGFSLKRVRKAPRAVNPETGPFTLCRGCGALIEQGKTHECSPKPDDVEMAQALIEMVNALAKVEDAAAAIQTRYNALREKLQSLTTGL